MDELKVLVVDDEELARERIISLLNEATDDYLISESPNGNDALKKIKNSKPDIIFLDIQMPGLDGISLAKKINYPAEIIFVTAYDKYAIKAFEMNALDYLLKPFDKERFFKTLKRVNEKLSSDRKDNLSNDLMHVIKQIKDNSKDYIERIPIKSKGRIFFINVEDIIYIESAGNYVNIKTETESHLLRETISNLESKLLPGKFIRIHRTHLINLSLLKEIKPTFNNQFKIIMSDGTKLTSSKSYYEDLKKMIEL